MIFNFASILKWLTYNGEQAERMTDGAISGSFESSESEILTREARANLSEAPLVETDRLDTDAEHTTRTAFETIPEQIDQYTEEEPFEHLSDFMDAEARHSAVDAQDEDIQPEDKPVTDNVSYEHDLSDTEPAWSDEIKSETPFYWNTVRTSAQARAIDSDEEADTSTRREDARAADMDNDADTDDNGIGRDNENRFDTSRDDAEDILEDDRNDGEQDAVADEFRQIFMNDLDEPWDDDLFLDKLYDDITQNIETPTAFSDFIQDVDPLADMEATVAEFMQDQHSPFNDNYDNLYLAPNWDTNYFGEPGI